MQIAQRPRQAFEIVRIGGWRNVGISREARETLQTCGGGAHQDVEDPPLRQGAKYALRIKRTRHRHAPRPQRGAPRDAVPAAAVPASIAIYGGRQRAYESGCEASD